MEKFLAVLLLPVLAAAAAVPNPSIHCVRFSGSQYVDTGVPARTGAKIELVAEFPNPGGDNGVLGARVGDDRFYLIHVYQSHLLVGAGNYTTVNSPVLAADTVYTIVSDFDDALQTITVDGTTVWSGTAATGRSLDGLTLFLGAVNKDRKADYHASMKVYSARIWLDGALVHDYRPDFRNGVAGFYDQEQALP